MSRLLPRIDPWPPPKRFVGLAWREASPTMTLDGEVLLFLLRNPVDGWGFGGGYCWTAPKYRDGGFGVFTLPTELSKLVVCSC